MCLDVDAEVTLLCESTHKARKTHICTECSWTIEQGERYRLWVVDNWGDNGFEQWKMCANCYATIKLGCYLTGCPEAWWWDMVHDLGDEGGFVGDILDHPGLTRADRLSMLRTVVGRRRNWRHRDGSLMEPIIDPWSEAA